MITNPKPYILHGINIRDNDYGKAVILSHNQLNESREFMLKNNINGIEINYMFGGESEDLEYLKEFTFVKHLRIVNRNADLTGIKYLKQLETLELGVENNQYFDFTAFPNLRACYFTWSKQKESIFKCENLEHLGIEKYLNRDLALFHNLKKLTTLGIGNSKIQELKGIENLAGLKKLRLSYLNNISNLKGVEHLTYLETLELYGLRKLNSIDNIANLDSIKMLSIDKCNAINELTSLENLRHLKKLVLNNMGDLKTLNSIENLHELEELFFIENTNILDGNLNPIKMLQKYSLVKFSFKNRKHYNLKREELGWPQCLS